MIGLFNSRIFRIYVVPGAVFQSVMVGGGYGTGREIVEYFTMYGAFGGLLGLLVAFAIIALVLALTFEFARMFRAFEYRKFFKHLLGRGWIAFEILIILQFLLVLAVLASAAGNILRDNFGIPYGVGLLIMLVLYSAMLFGTFIETGAGMLQGINERIDAYLVESRGKGLTRAAHATLAVSAIAISALLSLWGITNLIAEGYGTMAWGFLAVYVIPLLTIGFYRIVKA